MKIKSFIVIVATCSILSHWDAFGCDGGIFMKEIQLTQGKVAVVDDADFNWLNQWIWNPSPGFNGIVYASTKVMINGKKTTILMHRLILGLTEKHTVGDHIDHNGLNNQRSNLRSCSSAQNAMHRRPYNKPMSSKYKGVAWHIHVKKWYSKITVNGKRKHLGSFINEIDAAKAYDKAALELCGEFAYINKYD